MLFCLLNTKYGGLTRGINQVILFCINSANLKWLSEVMSAHTPKNIGKEDIVAWPIY